MLEAELEQSQSEMDSLHRLETQTAVYQHDMRHHLNMLDSLLSAGRPDEATAYIKMSRRISRPSHPAASAKTIW